MTPTTIDLERWGRFKIAVGMVCALVLGGGAILAAATGGVDGGGASVVLAWVFGSVILLLGVGITAFLLVSPPHASLTIDAAGVHHARSDKPDWDLSWSELAASEVAHSGLHVERGGPSNAGGYVHDSTDVTLARDWLRLTPTPAAARRPEIVRALRTRGTDDHTIALDLGPDPRAAQAVRSALAQFARLG